MFMSQESTLCSFYIQDNDVSCPGLQQTIIPAEYTTEGIPTLVFSFNLSQHEPGSYLYPDLQSYVEIAMFTYCEFEWH